MKVGLNHVAFLVTNIESILEAVSFSNDLIGKIEEFPSEGTRELYNGELTLGVFLEKVKSVINPNCNITWVSEKFLRDHKVSCWSQLPLWVYEEIQGFLKVNSGKAIAMGLKFRSIEQSIRDTHEWSKDIYRGKYLNKVLSRGKEKELLSLYNSL